MEVQNLKFRDTLPPLDVILRKPDRTIFALDGSTGYKLHILLSDGTKLTRTMTKIGTDAEGHLRYSWVSTDWDAGSSPDAGGAFTVGGLIVGPELPLAKGQREHRMEYEVLAAASARLTFPNGGVNAEEAYHVLRIWSDIGQG
jgi:hypothetical protein